MASLAVLLIMLGCGAYQYFKGTIFKALATIIIAICASIVAFGFFEQLAEFFISRGSNSRYPAIVPWAQPLCFALLFILTFSILQTLAMQLTKQPVDFGFIPECIGRVVCGIFLGLILSGLLLTTLAMAPLPNKYPYQRFDEANPDPESPNKVMPNADGFTAGWFALVSRGSFRTISNPRSFAVLHPDFLDQLYLNRHNDSGNVPKICDSQAIDIPTKNGAWYTPAAGIKDADGKPITLSSGHRLAVVRVGIKRSAITDAGKFTLSQLRLICKQDVSTQGRYVGKGKNAYPIGYFSGQKQIQTKKLSEQITIERTDFSSEEMRKYIDFAFGVPNDYTPVLLEFKLNCVAEIRKVVSSDQAPPIVPFVERSGSKKDDTKTNYKPRRPDYSPSRQDSPTDSSKRGTGLTLTRPIAPIGLDDEE